MKTCSHHLGHPIQVITLGIQPDCHSWYTEVTGEDSSTVRRITHEVFDDEFKAISQGEENLSDKTYKY